MKKRNIALLLLLCSSLYAKAQTITGSLLQVIGNGSAAGEVDLINEAKGAPGTAYRWSIYNMADGYGNSLQFWDYDTKACGPGGMCNSRLTLMDNGNVGIGLFYPQAKLEVDGNLMLAPGSGGSITFADGTVQSTAYTGVACGGDYAEQVNVAGDRRHFGPGDVLVVDPDHPGRFLKSDTPYATSVAGVYSTKPGFVGHAVGMPKTANQVPMAMLGIVPTKVSAINGAIHPGDLLVTSSILGTAMKGTDRSRLTGAILGKALGNLNSGTGVIEVLVTLQ